MINDDLKPRRRISPNTGAWHGQVLRGATDLEDPLYVIIPAFSKSLRFGPCRWQSRDALSMPAKGDECLVIFDNYRIPWVVAWWPYD